MWRRKCTGHTGVKLGRKWLNSCQPFVDENKKEKMLKRIPKLEEGPVPKGEDLENGREEGAPPEGVSKAERRISLQ